MLRSIPAVTNGRYLKAAVVLLLCASLCAAKSQITRIEVFRDGAQLLGIEGPATGGLNFWSGPGTGGAEAGMSSHSNDIADWKHGAVAPPADGVPVYKVVFLCEACEPARKDAWRCYGVRYAPGARRAPGLIQVPAAGDAEFPLNVQTIFRGIEGQWFHASAKWEEIVGAAIEDAVARRQSVAQTER